MPQLKNPVTSSRGWFYGWVIVASIVGTWSLLEAGDRAQLVTGQRRNPVPARGGRRTAVHLDR